MKCISHLMRIYGRLFNLIDPAHVQCLIIPIKKTKSRAFALICVSNMNMLRLMVLMSPVGGGEQRGTCARVTNLLNLYEERII